MLSLYLHLLIQLPHGDRQLFLLLLQLGQLLLNRLNPKVGQLENETNYHSQIDLFRVLFLLGLFFSLFALFFIDFTLFPEELDNSETKHRK